MPASPTSARRSRRRPHSRAVVASLACALLIGTAACSSPDGGEVPASPDRPSASATDEPIFASDEEALAAAVEAYESYSHIAEVIASEGGANPSRIEAVVGSEFASEHIREFEALQEAGLRIEGDNRLFNARLAERSEADGRANVSAYFCRDVSDTTVMDGFGNDVTPSRSPISAVIAHFASAATGSNVLIVEDVDLWDDDSFCA